jgi:hypothetical protein
MTFKVKIEEATQEQLYEYATATLQLEIETAAPAEQILQKIQMVKPDLKLLTLSGEAPVQNTTATAPVRVTHVPGASVLPKDNPAHFSNDPLVHLTITPTNDRMRSREVSVIVGPNQWWLMRGEPLAVPYRCYLALQQAVEYEMVPTGEFDPLTQMPIAEYQKQQPYPFTVEQSRFPTPDEIRDFHAHTDHVQFS